MDLVMLIFAFFEYAIPISKAIFFHIYIPNSQISSAIYHEDQRNLLAVNLTYKWLKMNIWKMEIMGENVAYELV